MKQNSKLRLENERVCGDYKEFKSQTQVTSYEVMIMMYL